MVRYKYELELSKDKMRELGFKYDYNLGGYVHTFGVYKNLLYCKMWIDEERNVRFDVYDNSNDTLYAPYYNRDYGKNLIVSSIDRKITKEFKKFNIVKVKQ